MSLNKPASDALGRVMAHVTDEIEKGQKSNQELGINATDSIMIKQAAQRQEKQQKQQQQQRQPKPLKPGDTSLAGNVSKSLQQHGGNLVGEAYPYTEKRDKTPRHPANKGVSARPGFVGS